VGRPFRFSSAMAPADDDLAQPRLEVALGRAALKEIKFEFEPIAAAYHYGRTIERAETVLVADFGGGTSDFSLLRIVPDQSRANRTSYEIVGNDGAGIAGDAFDAARMLRRLVAAELGRGSK